MNNIVNNIEKKNRPISVILKRNGITESIHKVHAVVCDFKGRILMCCGNPNYETFIRSALKPFQAIPFISSGAHEYLKLSNKGIAIACGSHIGTVEHARTAFSLLWKSDIDVTALKCPIPKNKESKLEHNCSGKHAAFLATCKKMNWSYENYLDKNHPLQIEILRKLGEIVNLPSESFITSKDECGAPTLFLKINTMAKLYAILCQSKYSDLEQILRAMIDKPELIRGEGEFDTELIKRGHGQIVSKGGAEGIQCIGRVNEGLGLSIKVEDGSRRAKHAAAIHILKQLEWITPTGSSELEKKLLPQSNHSRLEVKGKLRFQENL